MIDGGLNTFKILQKHKDLEDLIANGESEGLHLECKAPSGPKLSKDQKYQLAEAISGFSNTSGGVIVYGLSPTTHAHSGLDVITQIEAIGQIERFEKIVELAIPTLTTPPVETFQTRIIKERSSDTKGVLIVYIPMTANDPVQSSSDDRFYFRTGDEFKPAPYELIRRLFAAVDSPDLRVFFDSSLVKINKAGGWEIPVILRNDSTAIAEHVKVVAEITNPSACATIRAEHFHDAGPVNPGRSMFIAEPGGVIHRGLNSVVGTLHVQMAVAKRPKRRLDLRFSLYANRMRARRLEVQLHLAKTGFQVKGSRYADVY